MTDLLPVLISMAGVALALPLLAFLFGWSALRAVRGLDAEERFAAAWAVGIAVLALAQVAAFVLHVHHAVFGWSVVGAMAIVALALWRVRPAPGASLWACRPMAALWALGYCGLLAAQALLTDYVGGDWYGDWQMHYHFAQVFDGTRSDTYAYNNQYGLTARTPIFNAVGGLAVSLTGDHYWSYQLVASWLNWLFPLPLYLLARDRWGRRVGSLVFLLAPVNFWLLHLAWFTWTKLLSAYFLLLGLHFYLRCLSARQAQPAEARREFFAFWGCSLLAFLTHQVAIVYMAAVCAHALWGFRGKWGRWLQPRFVALLVVLGALSAGGWYGWLVWRFGLKATLAGSPTAIMAGSEFGWKESLLQNLWTSIVPVYLCKLFPWLGVSLTVMYQAAMSFYCSLVTGALGVPLLVLLGCRATARLGRRLRGHRSSREHATREETQALWVFAGVGGLLAMLLHPHPSDHGLAHNAYFTSVLIWLAMAWAVLASSSRTVFRLVAVAMLVEFLLLFWSHIWYVRNDPLVLDPYDLNRGSRLEDGLVFTAEVVGKGWLVAALVAAAAQLACLLLLLRWPSSDYKEKELAGD